ncbi:MAG TPA: UdgX family uracil-DNA binding protein, partial [Geminicoccaceae bacterium]
SAPDLQVSGTLHGADGATVRVPPGFVDLARQVICHRSGERFGLLYRLLWRIAHGERALLEICTDPEVRRVVRMAQSVRRDGHKMKAFVRFRQVAGVAPEQFVAWFEPEHHVVDAVAPFFQARFAGMRWSILTPERSVHWDGAALSFAAGARRESAPTDDALDDLWRTYYGHIFNPARLKVQAMRAEMPVRYWHNLPEARAIRPLVRAARQRTGDMIEAAPSPAPHKAAKWVPLARPCAPTGGEHPADRLRAELAACERCALHRVATQAVPGEGPPQARLMLIGEQPGDEEDLRGRPFVGPAGRLLDELMAESGIVRERTYLTNAVKHFRFQPRGKRRMHQRPDGGHIEHCRWWLEHELALVRPEVVVALGATAAQALLRHAVRMADLRGRPLPYGPAALIVTWHPSYLLRLREPAQRAEARAGLLADLRTARVLLDQDHRRPVGDLRAAEPPRCA